eukprot:m.9173 g.9173  ORF g.9173 m.9173 type:complete len:1871 (+) comp4018_c0_seq1:196-5808(+)
MSNQNRLEMATLEKELYFLMGQFLKNGPCKRAAEALAEEIDEHNLNLSRIDWTGSSHRLSFNACSTRYKETSPELLLQICKSSTPEQSMLSNGTVQSLYGRTQGKQSGSRKATSLNFVEKLRNRARHGSPIRSTVKTLANRLNIMHQVSGHLDAIYCVLYSRAGDRIFTGADDCLVKVWDSKSGMLLATFRGHQAAVTDLACSRDDSFLATADLTGVIRIWSLKTAETIEILRGHKAGQDVDLIFFGPSPLLDEQYLVSTSKDGTVQFHKYGITKMAGKPKASFDPRQNFFFRVQNTNERGKCPCRGECKCRIICAQFSPGGAFFATGSTDAYLTIYHLNPQPWEQVKQGPKVIFRSNVHAKQIESLKFSHLGDRIVTASSDGTARMWYNTNTWRSESLAIVEGFPEPRFADTACWTVDDRFVACSVFKQGSDHTIHVWSSHDRQLRHVLRRHEEAIVQIVESPTEPDIILSASLDARVILWDVSAGRALKEMIIYQESQPLDALDICFAPDGLAFTVTDLWGRWTQFGFHHASKFRQVPCYQFFNHDLAPVTWDANLYAIDQNTERPVHTLPQALRICEGGPVDLNTARTMESRLVSSVRRRILIETKRMHSIIAEEESKRYQRSQLLGENKCWGSSIGRLKQRPKVSLDFNRDAPRRQKPRRTMSYTPQRRVDQPTRTTRRPPLERQPIETLDNFIDDNESSSTEFDDTDSEVSDWERMERTTRRNNPQERAERALRRRERRDYDMMEDAEILANAPDDSPVRRRKTKPKKKKPRIPKEKYFPSDWISYDRPVATPYIPQLHDEVYYMREGHEEYVKAVTQGDLHELSVKSLPFQKIPGLKWVERCRVESIDYEVGPPSICVQKLLFLGDQDLPQVSIKFRDTEKLHDFIVLRERFDRAMSRQWKEGDRFQMDIPNKEGEMNTYYGTFLKRRMEYHLDSPWKSFEIQWDNEDSTKRMIDHVSPWEIDPVEPPLESTQSVATTVPTESSQIKSSLNESSEVVVVPTTGIKRERDDAEIQTPSKRIREEDKAKTEQELNESTKVSHVGTTQASHTAVSAELKPTLVGEARPYSETIPVDVKERLIYALDIISRLPIARDYRHEVDFNLYGDYLKVIAYPIHLHLIRSRLKNGFYRRVSAFLWDIEKLASNAAQYNAPEQPIIRCGNTIVEVVKQLTCDAESVEQLLDRYPQLTEGLGAELDEESVEDTHEYYFAKDDETPFQIAKNMNLDLSLLLALNKPIHPELARHSRLKEATQLIIPSESDITQDYLCKENETLISIGTKFNVEPQVLLALNEKRIERLSMRARLKGGTSIVVPGSVQLEEFEPPIITKLPNNETDDSAAENEPQMLVQLPTRRRSRTTRRDPMIRIPNRRTVAQEVYDNSDNEERDPMIRLPNRRSTRAAAQDVPDYNEKEEDDIFAADSATTTTTRRTTRSQPEIVEEQLSPKLIIRNQRTRASQSQADRNGKRPQRRQPTLILKVPPAQVEPAQPQKHARKRSAKKKYDCWEDATIDLHCDLMELNLSKLFNDRNIIRKHLRSDHKEDIQDDFSEIRLRLAQRQFNTLEDYSEVVREFLRVIAENCTPNMQDAATDLASDFEAMIGEVRELELPSSVFNRGVSRLNKNMVCNLITLHTEIMTLPEAADFNSPVDAEALGLDDYHDVIEKPMDLKTVQTGLQKGKYKTLSSYFQDASLVFTNAMTYNDPASSIFLNAFALQQRFELRIAHLTGYIHQPDYQSNDLVDDSSSKMLRRVKTLLTSFMRDPKVDVFKEPVPPSLKDYFKVILRPMDLGTIANRLKNSEYTCVEEFNRDVRTVWANAHIYNEPDSELNRIAVELHVKFEEELAKQVNLEPPTTKAPTSGIHIRLSKRTR